jgi:hypothetical protein
MGSILRQVTAPGSIYPFENSKASTTEYLVVTLGGPTFLG